MAIAIWGLCTAIDYVDAIASSLSGTIPALELLLIITHTVLVSRHHIYSAQYFRSER